MKDIHVAAEKFEHASKRLALSKQQLESAKAEFKSAKLVLARALPNNTVFPVIINFNGFAVIVEGYILKGIESDNRYEFLGAYVAYNVIEKKE